MDSTKQVAKKLARQSTGKATWAIKVGNDVGQVLTDKEGYGLSTMVDDIVDRYSKAGQDPPEVLYVDRDCCGHSSNRRQLHAWPALHIRLDKWHFKRRFSWSCTTDAHSLRRQSSEWRLLRDAKRGQLVERHLTNPTDDDVVRWLTKHELVSTAAAEPGTPRGALACLVSIVC
ncbi:hypothetical protein MAR_026731 [Mya arenaria]|uniref:Transposase n=1 Tax=Mya arenaria TaxID=6604 RepID=A0ABY7EZI3_MYAAR|nr:hypothetical protein MAR_026731 [Mya arenaria]